MDKILNVKVSKFEYVRAKSCEIRKNEFEPPQALTAPAGQKILRLLMPQITIFLGFWCTPMSIAGSPESDRI